MPLVRSMIDVNLSPGTVRGIHGSKLEAKIAQDDRLTFEGVIELSKDSLLRASLSCQKTDREEWAGEERRARKDHFSFMIQ